MVFEMADGNEHGRHWAEDLFEAHAACLILYGRALGLGHSESEDSVQDVFAQLLQRPAPPRKPANYLVRAFRNHALNRKRSLWRRLARELESRDWFEPAEDPHPAERTAMNVLANLPAEQREVIVLKFWHGMTFDEVGEVTGVSPNTAAGRFRYGMDRLRRQLKLTEDPSFFPCPTP
jgi:RNA polymerase sigma-70 factor (ECF subfamily)